MNTFFEHIQKREERGINPVKGKICAEITSQFLISSPVILEELSRKITALVSPNNITEIL